MDNNTSQNSNVSLAITPEDIGKAILDCIKNLPTSALNTKDAITQAHKKLTDEIIQISRDAQSISDLANYAAQNNPNIDTNRLRQNEQQYHQQVENRYKEINQSLDTNKNYDSSASAINDSLSKVGLSPNVAKGFGAVSTAIDAYNLGDAYVKAHETGDYKLAGEKTVEVIASNLAGAWATETVASMIAAGIARAAVARGAFAVGLAVGASIGVPLLAGVAFGWAIGKFGAWLYDNFYDWFNNLNRDGNYFLYDPLVLDLDGDGVELIAENDWNGVLFDFNGNGIKTATQWVKSDDGLLVFDRNANGKIDNGSELFGEDTPIRFITDPVYDGFSALQTIDTHPDFEINAKKCLKYQSTIAINDSILIFQVA